MKRRVLTVLALLLITVSVYAVDTKTIEKGYSYPYEYALTSQDWSLSEDVTAFVVMLARSDGSGFVDTKAVTFFSEDEQRSYLVKVLRMSTEEFISEFERNWKVIMSDVKNLSNSTAVIDFVTFKD